MTAAQNVASKISHVLLWAGLVSFAYNPHLTVIALAGHFILSLPANRPARASLTRYGYVLPAGMLLYLLYAVSMCWTTNVEHGWKDLETKLGLILFPVAAWLFPRRPGEINQFKSAWVASASLSLIVNLIHSTSLYFRSGDANSFFYDSFSFTMHPTYYTVFLNAALLISVADGFSKNGPRMYHQFRCHSLVQVLLLAGIVLTSSRAGILIAIATTSLYMFTVAYRNRDRSLYRKLIGGMLLSGVFFAATMILNPSSRFGVLFREITGRQPAHEGVDASKVDVSPVSHRTLLWKTALAACIRHPFGVGAGDVQDELVEAYRETGFEKAYVMKYNPHNQYLQTWLATGVPGLLLLLLMWFPFRRPGSVNPLCSVIVSVLALNGFFESVLEVQRGVILYGMIIAFLLVPDDPNLGE